MAAGRCCWGDKFSSIWLLLRLGKAEAAAAVSLPLGCGRRLWRYRTTLLPFSPSLLSPPSLPLLFSSISSHCTSPSLPSFLLPFSAALKHQHQQAVDNARTHTRTQQWCTLTCTASFSVWAQTQKIGPSYLSCCHTAQMCVCVCLCV